MKDGWMDVLFNREISHLKPIDRIIDPPRFPAGCGRSHLAATEKVPEHPVGQISRLCTLFLKCTFRRSSTFIMNHDFGVEISLINSGASMSKPPHPPPIPSPLTCTVEETSPPQTFDPESISFLLISV